MSIPHYGVWVAYPTHFIAQSARQDPKSPHVYLKFDHSKENEAAINVKSLDRDGRLAFWFRRDFDHPITQHLEQLNHGFHPIQSHRRGPVHGIDYLRTDGLFNPESAKLLPHDIPGAHNDVLDNLEPILNDAIHQRATAYIFGSSYGTGIHDIHMNQGSFPQFDNGVYQDGALFFRFPDGHWEAVFMAFASQRLPTNEETGEFVHGSKTLAQILGDD
ncbi:hypothetical protein ASPWEDRAFT_26425 [Aspergillus wentii DTO 134E9]|uniref:DUF2278 domain-containing protein n=1 Tax=Aspergillus wentii DTO 134E9 TaxID=1073089 RepID=A0A1L9RQA1_ASPWE|nr:uncharacterized protein ASPWEDRAFT_26425 [Aspergillus wentii DTO 134E9]KAI9923871.1 hypothetical protein MW887_008176 [Aspergillus wentii]OJJ36997.1 hypothetical protein ASPWEDRAFT_26425 [Aspergillus wentii DTO 134E9]